MLGARGVQTLLAVVVLGMMAYGMSTSPTTTYGRMITNTVTSCFVVVIPLARHIPRGSKLPHLLTRMVTPCAHRTRYRPDEDVFLCDLHTRKLRTPRPRGSHHALLVWRVHCDGGVPEG